MTDIEKLAKSWENILIREEYLLSLSLTKMEISALGSWVIDCFESFQEIYTDLLDKIDKSDQNSYGVVHDCVVDVFMNMDHIKRHIQDAENGFIELMNVLAAKSEMNDDEL